MNWTIGDDAIIRSEYALHVFSFVVNSDSGFLVAKDFFYKKITDIYNLYVLILNNSKGFIVIIFFKNLTYYFIKIVKMV